MCVCVCGIRLMVWNLNSAFTKCVLVWLEGNLLVSQGGVKCTAIHHKLWWIQVLWHLCGSYNNGFSISLTNQRLPHHLWKFTTCDEKHYLVVNSLFLLVLLVTHVKQQWVWFLSPFCGEKETQSRIISKKTWV